MAGIVNDDLFGENVRVGTLTPSNPYDISVEKSVAGLIGESIQNTSANAAAGVNLQLIAEPAAADAFTLYNINGATTFSCGIDNSDSDAYKVTTGSTPSAGSTIARVSTAGEWTYPLQPAFLAYLGTTDTNATGDGTNFVIGSGNALTEVFDQNSNFNTNGTFTTPITGRYFLQGTIYLLGGTSLSSANYFINTSNRNFRVDTDIGSSTGYRRTICCVTDMDAADTSTTSITAVDTGGKVDDIFGAATPFTWFSGNLVS